MSNGQGEEGEEGKGGGERWTRGDCAGGGVQEVQVVKKKEKGDFGGRRKEECIRRSLCGDEAVSQRHERQCLAEDHSRISRPPAHKNFVSSSLFEQLHLVYFALFRGFVYFTIFYFQTLCVRVC